MEDNSLLIIEELKIDRPYHYVANKINLSINIFNSEYGM